MNAATYHSQPYLLNRHAGDATRERQQNKGEHVSVPAYRWRRCALTGDARGQVGNATTLEAR